MDLLTQALEAFRRIAALASRRTQPGITQAQLLELIEKAARDEATKIGDFKLMMNRKANDNGEHTQG